MKPFVGASVLYFPRDELKPPLEGPASCWAAIVTFVHDREFGPEGEEIGPWVVSLAAFPPPVGPHSVGKVGQSSAELLRVSHAPLYRVLHQVLAIVHARSARAWPSTWPPRARARVLPTIVPPARSRRRLFRVDRRQPTQALGEPPIALARRLPMSMLLDDTHAVMTRAEFLELADYSSTIPTGSYFGKIWRRGEPYRARSDADRTWYLGEYFDDGTPDMVAIKWRAILFVD